MTKFKSIFKEKFHVSLLSGLGFAALMAGNDYLKGQDFSINAFILNFLIFGFIMGVFLPFPNKNKK